MSRDPDFRAQLQREVIFDRGLRPGQVVMVCWGYGSGFRAHGIGRITKVFRQSVRVTLANDVPDPADPGRVGWPAGYELVQIPRWGTPRWQPGEHCVEPAS